MMSLRHEFSVMRGFWRILAALVFGFVLVQLDQWTKLWASANLIEGQFHALSGAVNGPAFLEHIGLQLAHNYGVVFSLGLPLPLIFAVVLAIFGLGLWLLIREKLWQDIWLFMALLAIGAGGLGNLIDRVRLGFVIDFIQVGWWPIFNLADVWICLGVLVVLLRSWKR